MNEASFSPCILFRVGGWIDLPFYQNGSVSQEFINASEDIACSYNNDFELLKLRMANHLNSKLKMNQRF